MPKYFRDLKKNVGGGVMPGLAKSRLLFVLSRPPAFTGFNWLLPAFTGFK